MVGRYSATLLQEATASVGDKQAGHLGKLPLSFEASQGLTSATRASLLLPVLLAGLGQPLDQFQGFLTV